MLDPPPEAFLPDLIEDQLAQSANACSGDIGSALCKAFTATDSVLRQNGVGQVARASGDTRTEEFGKECAILKGRWIPTPMDSPAVWNHVLLSP